MTVVYCRECFYYSYDAFRCPHCKMCLCYALYRFRCGAVEYSYRAAKHFNKCCTEYEIFTDTDPRRKILQKGALLYDDFCIPEKVEKISKKLHRKLIEWV